MSNMEISPTPTRCASPDAGAHYSPVRTPHDTAHENKQREHQDENAYDEEQQQEEDDTAPNNTDSWSDDDDVDIIEYDDDDDDQDAANDAPTNTTTSSSNASKSNSTTTSSSSNNTITSPTRDSTPSSSTPVPLSTFTSSTHESTASSTSATSSSPSKAAKKKDNKAFMKTATMRLSSDLKVMENDAPEGISASPIDASNLFIWRACIFGPPDTPWEGGVFELQLHFPPEYPQKPPAVRFTSKIFHPNVYSTGDICLDIIQLDRWSPVHSVSTILTSIQSLLTDPNPSSPANPEAAKLLIENPKEYRQRVRACAQKASIN